MDDPYIDNTTERSMDEQTRKALELARASLENFWLNGQSTQSERFEAAQAMSAIDAALSAPAAPVARPEPSDGWASAYTALEKNRNELAARVRFLEDHAKGEVWVWQGDGEDHPESLANSLPVVIRADQLRELIAATPAAPDLLDALNEMLAVFAKPHNETLREVVDARAAIAKATGND